MKNANKTIANKTRRALRNNKAKKPTTTNIVVNFFQKSKDNNVVNNHFKWSLDMPNDELSFNKIIGTVLNELFTTVSEAKEIGAKLFNLAMPIGLRIEVKGVVIDTAKANKEYQLKLKLQNTSKSKRKFAQRSVAIIKAATRGTEIKDINTLLAELA
jgi:hypothetical protein